MIILGACAGFVLGLLYVNLLEYTLHRWVMHGPRGVLLHLGDGHVRVHHGIFDGEHRYHVERAEDRARILLFTRWQATLWLGAHAPLAWALQWVTGWPLLWSGMSTLAVYYSIYEYLHWCMHDPTGRWIERTCFFHWLDANHRLHHRLWRTNFNIFLPIGDLIFGTLRPA